MIGRTHGDKKLKIPPKKAIKSEVNIDESNKPAAEIIGNFLPKTYAGNHKSTPVIVELRLI